MKTQPDNSGREMESGPVLLHDAETEDLDCIVCAEIGRAMGYEE